MTEVDRKEMYKRLARPNGLIIRLIILSDGHCRRELRVTPRSFRGNNKLKMPQVLTR